MQRQIWPSRWILVGFGAAAVLAGCERKPTGTREEKAAGATTQGAGAAAVLDLSNVAGEFEVPEVEFGELSLGLQTKIGDARYQARRDPNDPQRIIDLGALCYVHGFKPAALRCFRRAAALQPDDARTWYYIALTCDELKDVACATAAYEKCLRLMDYKFARERLIELGGQPPPSPPATQPTTDADEPSQELVRDLWKLHLLYLGWDAPTMVRGALNMVARGAYQPAEQILRDAREADPDGVLTADALGQLYLLQNRPADAEREFETVVSSPAGKEMFTARINLALLLTLRRDFERAEKLLREGLELSANDPNMQPEFANALAWNLATNPNEAGRKPEEAIQLAESAVARTQRKDHRMLDTLAAAYAAAGRFEDAARAIEEAIRLAEPASVSHLEQYRQRQALYAARKPFYVN